MDSVSDLSNDFSIDVINGQDLQSIISETEIVSEDELPAVQAAKVPEAEAVSDDELPAPKRADLPTDIEVVSDDDLLSSKSNLKRKVDNDIDSNSSILLNSPNKKLALNGIGDCVEESVVIETNVVTNDDNQSEAVIVKPKLPELEKYWKTVNNDPGDFTGWTLLLQYVDQENDAEAAREAYDAFLSHYPYCYGYWRKYADYENRKGNKKKCDEVFERGLKAIPLSVDLWLHYLMYVRNNQGEEAIRSQYERAISACGLEFRSDRLWDGYIKWEIENRYFRKVIDLYDRLIKTPTQGYSGHFDNFSSFVQSHDINDYLSPEEFQRILREVRIEKLITEHKNEEAPLTEDQIKTKLPEGLPSSEEREAMKEKVIHIRKHLRKITSNEVTDRWNFEEGIKRPYFHVKALEKCQLQNWKDYLDFEINRGNKERIIVLFERCLIACALYEEFWLKYLYYLESLNDTDKIRNVYERACTIHHMKKPNLHLKWSLFEECQGNVDKAAEILTNLDKSVPNILQVAYRRINLERRRNNTTKCSQLFEHYITNSKNKVIASNLAIKYSRFVLKIFKNLSDAIGILKDAIEKDQSNPRLYLQIIDLSMHKDVLNEEEIIGYINKFLSNHEVDIEQKALFAQRKLEFLEDFGADIHSVRKAYDEYQSYCKSFKEMKKKRDEKNENTSKKLKVDQTTASVYNYAGYQSGTNGAYGPYPSHYGAQFAANTINSGAADPYQYQNWQYSQAGYSGAYNQWGGYSYY